jgi:hypothetical protein
VQVIAQGPSFRTKPYDLTVGLHFNAMDDDGRQLRKLFDPRGMHALAFPTAATVDWYYKNGWSFEGILSFNRYKANNIVNGQTGREGFAMAIDAHAKYNFSQLINYPLFQKELEIFGVVGLSYTMRPPDVRRHMVSPSIGAGANYMFTEFFGLQVRSTFKMATVPYFFRWSNYLHHHIGAIYRFGSIPWQDDFSKRKYKWLFKTYRYKGGNTRL